MATRVTDGAKWLPPSFRASRGFAARAHALPLLNLKKKRDCSQSRGKQQRIFKGLQCLSFKAKITFPICMALHLCSLKNYGITLADAQNEY